MVEACWLRAWEGDRMAGEGSSVALEHSGRQITQRQLELICETVEMFPGLSLVELAATISEHLRWYTAAGEVKRDACVKLLRKLQASAVIQLSEKQLAAPRRCKPTVQATAVSEATDAGAAISGSLRTVGGVRLKPVVEVEQKRLWNEYVQRYHRLGYKKPFGYRMRYFICSPGQRLGCFLVSGAAKALGVRDGWIGWDDRVRLQNLSWVVSNSRFLIFPWVEVKNLASHALALLARRVRQDWEDRWGYRPLLMESFVDPAHYRGSCYKAAGWQYLGMTTGEGLVRAGKQYTTTPKMIFVKPLCSEFRSLLCRWDLQRMAGGRAD